LPLPGPSTHRLYADTRSAMHTSGGASRPLRAVTLLVAHEADLLIVERILCDPWISGEQLQHGGLRHSSVGSPSRGFSLTDRWALSPTPPLPSPGAVSTPLVLSLLLFNLLTSPMATVMLEGGRSRACREGAWGEATVGCVSGLSSWRRPQSCC
jgi:hypothetical protein